MNRQLSTHLIAPPQVAIRQQIVSNYKNVEADMFEQYERDYNAMIFFKNMYEQFNGVVQQTWFNKQFVSMHDEERAKKCLNADYWLKLFRKVDLLSLLPSLEAEQKVEDLTELKGEIPKFEKEIVVETLRSYAIEAEDIFLRRVDGIFQKLSGDHVTNRPEGFGQTIIMANVGTEVNPHSKAVYIHDLRLVIARLRNQPAGDIDKYNTQSILSTAKSFHGQWQSIDGNAFELKMYKNLNAHIRFDAEIADKLNECLAQLYPKALAPITRRKQTVPTKSSLTPTYFMVPHDVRDIFKSMRFEHPRIKNPEYTERSRTIRPTIEDTTRWEVTCYSSSEKRLMKAVCQIMDDIGGVFKYAHTQSVWVFDFDPRPIILDIKMNGVFPEQSSHQFYQTTDRIRDLIDDMLVVDDGDKLLEPQAGYGVLASLLPKEHTTCVELSSFNAKVLKQKGYNTVNQDFLEYADKCQDKYDVIVSNPPYKALSYLHHTKAALSLLSNKGYCIAVLPASIKTHISAIENEFPVDVHIIQELQEQFVGTGLLNICIVKFSSKQTVIL